MTTSRADDSAILASRLAESERALRSLQRRYDTLSTGMSTGLVVQDEAGEIVDANAAAVRLLGLTLEQMQGRVSADPRWGTVDEDGADLPGHLHPISVARTERRAVHGVTMGVLRPDGSRVWLDVSGDVVVEDDHVVLAYSTFTDITARHELAASVRDQEQRLRAIIDDSPLGIATVRRGDDGWAVVSANAAFGRQVGHHDGTAVGLALLDLLAPDQRVEATALLGLMVDGGEPTATSEWRVERPDGTTGWLRVVASPLWAGDAVPTLLLQAEDVTEQRAAHERMREMAHHDALTGLANRLLVTQHITAARDDARRTGELLAVLFLDLDHFKFVNDTLGHDVGDELLTVLAERLASVPGPQELPARLGGDEFLVVLPGLGADAEAAAATAGEVADRIIAALAAPVDLDGEVLQVGVSIGIALGTGLEDQRELLRRADLAMYQAKDDGRHRHRLFEASMRVAAERRMSIERELIRAIEGGELRVHLQPVVDARTGELIAAEALLRWEHPVRGLLAPADFLEVAEESGLIVRIDSWVIGEACRVLRLVRDNGVDLPTVTVNVSGKQLLQRDVPRQVSSALRTHDLEPDSLAIELTERTLIGRTEPVLGQLNSLQQMGVRIGLDDFGTGHSSLSNAKDLPVEFLKVDRAFVADLLTDRPSRAVVAGIARLADEMALPAIAEGVEDVETLEAVRAMGCVAAQGWLFGRPVPPESFVAPALIA